jgi:hypothetical protein
MGARLRLVLLLLLAIGAKAGAGQAAPQQPQTAPNDSSDQIASRLLQQLGQALKGHSQKTVLAVFDFPQMKRGMLFKEQITNFLFQTESIRLHANLVESAVEGDRATMTVDAEMELEPRNGGTHSRRSERVSFAAARNGGEWKFVDVQPRSFFSLP